MPTLRTPHPAKAVIVGRGELIKEAAAAVGVAPSVLSNVLNGHNAPWPALRRRLSEHLGMPESELFHDDAPQLADAAADLNRRSGATEPVADSAALAKVSAIVRGGAHGA